MNNILVTGSSGQLGEEVVLQLRSKGYSVTGIDIIPSRTTDKIVDISNPFEVQNAIGEMGGVIHTAAIHGKHYALDFPREDFIRTNINGTFNLLQASLENKIEKFVSISTTSIYGNAMVDSKNAVWVDEMLTPNPRDIYDITKLTSELLCRDYFEKEGLESVVLRVSRFLPEPDNLKANHRLYRGLDERDGAAAVILALEKKFKDFEIFNISNLSPFQKEDLTEIKKNPKAVILKYYPEAGEVYARQGWEFPKEIDRVYCIDKAREMFNYKPKFNFDIFLR
ncbi:NAD-dependent epimerase/dehydratase family protein [Aquiflexum lacus]|uniref:NAD-dependent epimerase/dehydratase family protein n=1 Tax=Aquiflexum lacus TaxID=2483805 RepID=UPI001893FBB4|nr:NAD(P)-dependent oxidoreductase [Aquiflexum lacus]